MSRAPRRTQRSRRQASIPIITPRLLLLADALDADGLPRAALAFPGRPYPIVFPTFAAAVAALHATENSR